MNACIVLSGENRSGILFAEDFDAVIENDNDFSENHEDSVSEEPDLPPVLTYSQEEMDAAIEKSVSDAIEKTRSEMDICHQKEIQKIEEENKEGLHSLLESIDKKIEMSLTLYSTNLSKSIVEAVVSAFPSWGNSQKYLWSSNVLESVLPFFSDNFDISIKIHPDCCSEIREIFPEESFVKKSWIKFIEDSSLNRTDFDIQYADGKVFRNIDFIVSNILTDLLNSMSQSQKEEVANG
ncbi:hypothetical protein A0U92_03750 [Acetobacter aceti]|uniref:Flagellar assembly protein FliH/Type III secretion system HrpE domain-containing protein n=1 Tax=Acetobacter aceti TaxID=435 RepID=A0A1U9KE05_ACEAC|nr:hypothetical protein [Acetobacter aceti]AQS84030.1 hypothetical protein A0U92_03750 [Acetobacter aceti]